MAAPQHPASRTVVFALKLGKQRVDVLHRHENRRARRRVAMMLAQVQNQVGPAHLQVERKIGLEAVFPVDGKAEKVDVKLLGFLFRKDANDRNRGREVHNGLQLVDRDPSA